MDARSQEMVDEILRIQKSLASPIRKQWYRKLGQHIAEQSETIERLKGATDGNS